MGTYNRIKTVGVCPRCSSATVFEIETRLGDTSSVTTLKVGDTYPWRPRKGIPNGGRPKDGDIDGEGYATCTACQRDFFVRVIIRGDVIARVEIDQSRPGYVPD